MLTESQKSNLKLNVNTIIFAGGILLGLHYEAIIEMFGNCPIPIVCGVNRLGKIKCSVGALSLIGNSNNFYSSVKERFIPPLCSRSTLPPVLDDIKKPKVIEDIAMAFYNSGKDGTCLLETTRETLDGLDKDER